MSDAKLVRPITEEDLDSIEQEAKESEESSLAVGTLRVIHAYRHMVWQNAELRKYNKNQGNMHLEERKQRLTAESEVKKLQARIRHLKSQLDHLEVCLAQKNNAK